LSLNSYRRKAFYYGGVKGYLDYPTFDELETTAVVKLPRAELLGSTATSANFLCSNADRGIPRMKFVDDRCICPYGNRWVFIEL